MMKSFKFSFIILIAFACILSACKKDTNSSIKFYNTSEFLMEDVRVNGKNIGVIESGKASDYIEYNDFKYFHISPYVNAEIGIEGVRIKNDIPFWICQIDENPISIAEGKKQIEIKVSIDSIGNKHFRLLNMKNF